MELTALAATFVIGILIQRNNAAIEKQNSVLEGIEQQYLATMERQRDVLRAVEEKFSHDVAELARTNWQIIQSIQRSESRIQNVTDNLERFCKQFINRLEKIQSNLASGNG